MGQDEVQRTWKEYFEVLYNMDTEQVTVHMCGFGEVRRENYFGGDPDGRTELEVRANKLEKGKAACR